MVYEPRAIMIFNQAYRAMRAIKVLSWAWVRCAIAFRLRKTYESNKIPWYIRLLGQWNMYQNWSCLQKTLNGISFSSILHCASNKDLHMIMLGHQHFLDNIMVQVQKLHFRVVRMHTGCKNMQTYQGTCLKSYEACAWECNRKPMARLTRAHDNIKIPVYGGSAPLFW